MGKGYSLGLILLLFSVNSFAKYQPGKEVCDSRGFRTKEYGHFIDVPANYDRPTHSLTLYSWLNSPFDQSKPSLIYVNGGPGAHSHSTFNDLSKRFPDWNIIFFDQRGILCSRPQLESSYLDIQTYSSRNIAEDINEIRKFYDIDKATVFGSSYGTVPATIFASLHPEQTRSLILEGTVFEGGKSTWNSNLKLQIMNSFFSQLSQKAKQRVIYFSSKEGIISGWFANKVSHFMRETRFQDLAAEWLNINVIGDSDQSVTETLSSMKTVLDSILAEAPDGEGVNPFVYSIIACKELGATDNDVTFDYVFSEGKLVESFTIPVKSKICDPIGIGDADGTRYRATDYQVHIPTYYFQGESDGATTMDNAVLHFEHVPQSAYFLLLKNGGHHPAIDELTDGLSWIHNDRAKSAFTPIFLKAMNAEPIIAEDLDPFNAANREDFVLQSRRANN